MPRLGFPFSADAHRGEDGFVKRKRDPLYDMTRGEARENPMLTRRKFYAQRLL